MPYSFRSDQQLLADAGLNLAPNPQLQLSGSVSPAPQPTQAVDTTVAPVDPTISLNALRQVQQAGDLSGIRSLTDTLAAAGQMKKAEEAKKQQEQVQQDSQEQIVQPDKQEKTAETILREAGKQEELNKIKAEGTVQEQAKKLKEITGAPSEIETQTVDSEIPTELQKQGTVFADKTVISARANQPYLDGRINRGTDFAGKPGTDVALPEGEWEVIEARGDVSKRIRDDFTERQNFGYGNSVRVRNTETGEVMRLSHLQKGSVPKLKPGQTLEGGTVVGKIGQTGNATGNHLDVEFHDGSGMRRDILNTAYRDSFTNATLQETEIETPEATRAAQIKLAPVATQSAIPVEQPEKQSVADAIRSLLFRR